MSTITLDRRYYNALPDGDRHHADDLLQETFLRAWRALTSDAGPDLASALGQHSSALRGWLYTIARHLVIDHWRRTANRRSLSLDDPRGLASHASLIASHDAYDPYDLPHLADALCRLRPRYRQVLRLQLDGYSYAGIATILGINEHAVRALRHRAITNLRHHLQDL